uniref:Multifunctional fusion protein n=1 Tax=Eucampia antarctica TaxID=49252 RepID=A0A7S2RL12_9STRA|mmetsp:Transcript_23703/g.22735  ORF Transcript_23703/g.22735 Transcript_23703/m.22735 type:complete len:636 (+) Transcript_23703:65-1972(+)|eukprot:CAMPEP_0197836856 /NCGR_PEP_ID=MMETSP1437-20131217/30274_1 /TAXON_ID=49252 ORGANISM="Eucampia antarctica, Strain CCMP1452" /NCGR_SAMPLE_ID=MMETSP1437 /ASSEMBLY_ACC=CAM_ASM_001096 /LENGTH=635 /DNA_ID=CAMNT_0043443373 /DNA_START=64 /DNA_END=1971 /DNA_ORIENTATION=-
MNKVISHPFLQPSFCGNKKVHFLFFVVVLMQFGSLSSVFGLTGGKRAVIIRSIASSQLFMSASSSLACDICVVGSANQDVTVYLASSSSGDPNKPHPLKWGETIITSTTSSSQRSSEITCGGKGANQAVAAASFFPTKNNKNVHMVCRVGEDSFGKTLLRNLSEANVSYYDSPEDTVISKNSSTGMASILVDGNTGDNMIVVVPGANHDLHPQDVKIPDGCKVVLTQLEIPVPTAITACQIAVKNGCLSILNPAPCNDITIPNELYQNVDILVPNEVELRSLCRNTDNVDDEETMARKLLTEKRIRRAVIVTLGARGAMIVAREEHNADTISTFHVQAPPELPCHNQPVVDTVGAGDAFCGALAAHLSSVLLQEQKITSQDIIAASTKACGFASISVRTRGAQSSYPKLNEIPHCLRVVPQGNVSSNKSSHNSSQTNKIPLTFVTGNLNKLKEVQNIMMSDNDENNNFPFTLTNVKLKDLPEIQGRDPIEIAQEKCKWAAKRIMGPVLIEDTSLCFVALNSLPGPYIKWFLESCGHDGLNTMLAGFDDKSAYAQTICAVSFDGGKNVHIVEGRTYGKIVSARGDTKFGWDPIFQPDEGGGKTYAEMTMQEKNAISHRARALANLKELLQNSGPKL